MQIIVCIIGQGRIMNSLLLVLTIILLIPTIEFWQEILNMLLLTYLYSLYFIILFDRLNLKINNYMNV